jgi:hypothetical protein
VLIISSNISPSISILKPSFRHATSSVNEVKSDNSSKNADAIIAMLGLCVAVYYGEGTYDNASNAQKEIPCTFEHIMRYAKNDDSLDEHEVHNQLYKNGVERKEVGFGDPFCVADLCVTWASVYAFGDTEKADVRFITANPCKAYIHYILTIHPSHKPKWTNSL